MCVEQLESNLTQLGQERKPKFIYVLTTSQNPTRTNMSLDSRRALLQIAEKHRIPIVEDNCYADVHFDGQKPKALYALSDCEDIVYMCSVSKILAPGFRLGYLMASPAMLARILARRHDAGSNYLAAAIVAELYRDGLWELPEEFNVALKTRTTWLWRV